MFISINNSGLSNRIKSLVSCIKLAEENNTDYKVKRARLRDEEGKWVNEYDSIGQGIYEIDGKIYQPQLAVKTFQQQLPLSYYYIDTRQITEGISFENIVIE